MWAFTAKAATVAILVVAVADWGVRFYAAAVNAPAVIGMDGQFYFSRASAWLAGDGFYLPWQLTGEPYLVEQGAATYPPVVLWLLVPFAAGLPTILWWAIPLGIVAASIVVRRPPVWAWPLLALVLLYPRTWVVVALGNPSMWMIAAVAAAVVLRWPAALILLKPTLAPLALLGIKQRSFWLAVAVIVAAGIPFGAMWIDYVTVLRFATTNRGLEYLAGEWPIALALLVALGWENKTSAKWPWTSHIPGQRPRNLPGQ